MHLNEAVRASRGTRKASARFGCVQTIKHRSRQPSKQTNTANNRCHKNAQKKAGTNKNAHAVARICDKKWPQPVDFFSIIIKSFSSTSAPERHIYEPKGKRKSCVNESRAWAMAGGMGGTSVSSLLALEYERRAVFLGKKFILFVFLMGFQWIL